MSSNEKGRGHKRFIATLRTLRLLGTVAAFVTVVAGACGFDYETQIVSAISGAVVGGILDSVSRSDMNPEVVASPPWGRSDFYTLIVGVPLRLFACYLHRKAVSACGSECADMFLGMMSTALSRPLLIMILVDPFVKKFSSIREDQLL